jgi:predicted nuclease of restriction endonuclease-like RecB superfamily
MLLPLECLAYQIVEDRVLPSWLGEDDAPFVEGVIELVSKLHGLSVGEAEMVAGRGLATLARQAKVAPRIAEALWAVERRRWEAEVDAPVDPEALRDVLFELSARLPRDQAISEAARRLGIPSQVVLGSVFADRQIRRVLVAPAERPRATDLLARYNLAVVQSLIARSMDLEACLVGDTSAIIAAAKRDGLLARFDPVGDATRLALVGPLSIFHDTAKYGRSIARFVPSLLALPHWSIRTRITLGTRSAELRLADGGAISFPRIARTLPAAPDGRLARRVSRALRSAGVRVDLHPPLVRSGSHVVIPDFALEWRGARVLVDIVPFATHDYLASKQQAALALGEPMLVCVDERFATMTAPWLLPYRREVDAWALFGAAKRLLERPSRSDWGNDDATAH